LFYFFRRTLYNLSPGFSLSYRFASLCAAFQFFADKTKSQHSFFPFV
jgi:hypothetical protein